MDRYEAQHGHAARKMLEDKLHAEQCQRSPTHTAQEVQVRKEALDRYERAHGLEERQKLEEQWRASCYMTVE